MRYAAASAIAIVTGVAVWAAVTAVGLLEDALSAAVAEISRRPL